LAITEVKESLTSPKYLRPLFPEELADWSLVMGQSVGVHPFLSSAFLMAYQTAVPQIRTITMGIFEQEKLVGGFPVFERNWGPFRRAVNPPLVPYGSPFWLPSHTTIEIIEPVLDYFLETYASTSMEFLPTIDLRSFSLPVPWHLNQRNTLLKTLLGNEDVTLQALSQKRRHAFRRASKLLIFQPDACFTEKHAALIAQSYARHQRKLPIPVTNLLHLVNTLKTHQEAIVCSIAFKHLPEEPLAVVVFLSAKKTAYEWLAGATLVPKLELMGFLLISAFTFLHHKGMEKLDFVGANHPSIAAFKRKFADAEIPYVYVQQTSNPFLRMAEWIRRKP